ncbi:MAG: Holliday junction branch migration protein RuvA [Ruminococcaceae bacterium]|nr:Holliday junction branch migration protein RuvA [Oscillospiraceae bacterium]
MIAFVRGTIVARHMDCLILESGGIGYRIHASPELLSRFPASGTQATIHTYLYLREDIMALYGFPSPEELSLFELLLTVSGIGPKVASTLVGVFSPGQFAMAVLSGDVKALTQARGIGRKGAERLILELKDKLKGADLPPGMTAPAQLPAEGRSIQTEAASALVVLGYSGAEAARAVAAVSEQADGLEDMIRQALRQLSR